MSEVKRWKLKGFIPGIEGESKAVFQPTVVLAEDYDAALARDVALRGELAETKKLAESLERSMKNHRHELGLSNSREAALREELANHESASKLMDAWVSEKGQMPWVTAINIMAIVTKMPDEERQRLIDMDDGAAERGALIAERDALQQRLTVAEQLLRECQPALEKAGNSTWQIDEALKPAAEPDDWDRFARAYPDGFSTCNQIREESGLPTKNPCVACNNGACIDR